MLKMTHVIYPVPDVGIAKRFLEEVIGLRVTADDLTISGERFLTMGSESFGIELQLVECAQFADVKFYKPPPEIVGFILRTEDVFSFIDHAKSLGLTIHREPTDASYGITAIFEDPFGNLWDVVQRTDV